jgi:L-seryl-tRNA(Ser) seleniumtransferase
MLDASEAELEARARRLAELAGGEVVRSVAKVGGGALPLLELEGPVVALEGPAEELAARLRTADPPVLARIVEGRVLLDPRTLAEEELPWVARALRP